MASRFYGINRGQYYKDITNATSTQSTDIEIRMDTGKNLTLGDLMLAIDLLQTYIMNGNTHQGGAQDFGDNNG